MFRRAWPALAAALTFGVVGPAAAQTQTDTLRIADAIETARAANPTLRAARLNAEAAMDRVGPAGALPDPEVSLGLMNRPLDGFGTAQPMTMNQIQVTQMLPWPGRLGNRAAAQRHLADAASLDAKDTELQLVARLTETYFRTAALDRALGEMADTRDLLRQFLEVAQTMYSVGNGQQADVLQAQVAVARMTADIATTTAQREGLAAHLNALLGKSTAAPVGALELTEPTDTLPDADALMAMAAAHRPALQAARARIAAAESAERAASRDRYPSFMISAAYSERPQFDDMGTVMLGISIPLWSGRKQNDLRRAAQADRAMRDAQARDLYDATFAQITALRAEAHRARTLLALYRTAILPQARASVESALGAYRVGKVDYMTLVNDEMTVNRYAIERYHLIAAYRSAVAGLRALVGDSQGAIQ